METSRSNGRSDRVRIDLPPDASPAEAAAIATAIECHLTADDRGPTEDRGDWPGRRWAFAGRLEAIEGRTGRVPLGAPADPWTAAGRADRY